MSREKLRLFIGMYGEKYVLDEIIMYLTDGEVDEIVEEFEKNHRDDDLDVQSILRVDV
jgi:hypothetical protein